MVVLDATGKIPDGILSDVTDYCAVVDYFSAPGLCELLAPNLTLPIPQGNTVAFDSFEGCIQVKAENNDATMDELEWESFEGKYCMVQIVSRDSLIASGLLTLDEPKRATKAASAIKPGPDSRIGVAPGFIGGILNPLTPEGGLDGLLTTYLDMMSIKFGVCIPDACTREDVFNNYLAVYEGIYGGGNVLTCATQTSQDEVNDLNEPMTIFAM